LIFLALSLEECVAETFHVMLRKARRNARDPEYGGQLSQERFAELLAQEPRVMSTTGATVSNWERGKVQPRGTDRAALQAIVTVLLRCGGFRDISEANALLACGGYAPLSQQELPNQQEVPWAVERDGHVPAARTLIAIRHQSMEQIPARGIQTALPAELQACEIVEITLDQSDLFQNRRLIDPYAAVRRQRDLEERVAELFECYPDAYLAYYGIAHIPLLFLAGYTLSNRRAIRLFENDRYTRSWDLLQRCDVVPPLRLCGMPSTVEQRCGEVVVRVSISYRVTEDVVAEVIPEPLASLELGLEQPQLDAITSEEQLRDYTRAFRQMMDEIHHCFPHARGIHIFYAGPPSLAFSFGQLVSKTIHPRLIVYNFFGQDRPRYSWGLDLSGDLRHEDVVLRPMVRASGSICRR
jgi:hypothetical protein